MIPTSLAYQEAIKKAHRGQTHIKIEYGIEDKNKIYSSSSSPTITYSTTLQNLWEDSPMVHNYALLSNDYMTTDGVQEIAPDDPLDVDVERSGCIANILSDNVGATTNLFYMITLTSQTDTKPKEIYGFVMRFDETNNTYPTDIEVNIYGEDSTLLVNRRFEGLNSPVFTFDEEIQGVVSIKIIIHKINKYNAYLRLTNLMLGINMIYTEKELMNNAFSYKRSIDMLSNELSFNELGFNVNNIDQSYNPFKLSGVYKRFDIMQSVTFSLGLEYEPNSYEWMKVATLFTNDFSFENTNYSVECVDLLSTLTFVNYFTPNLTTIKESNITYGDIINMIIEKSDGAIELNDFKLIDKVKNAKVNTYIPALPINEVLQLIANINQCVVFTNRDGVIEFKDAYIPKVTFSDNGHMDYSSVDNAYNTNQLPLYTYAQLTTDFVKAEPNEWQVIRPDDNNDYLGYVSSMMCDENGIFSVKPKIVINYSSPDNVDSLYLVFDHLEQAYPKDFTVTYYNANGDIIDSLVYNNNKLYEISKDVDYRNVSRYEIEITNWSKGNRRAVINRIGAGIFDDYYLDFHFMYNKPTIEKIGYIKDVSCKYYIESRELKDGQAVLEDIVEATFYEDGDHYFYCDTSYDGFVVEKIDGSGTIDSYDGNYSNACYFKVSGNTSGIKVKLMGYKLKSDEATVSLQIAKKGESQEVDNPLCSQRELALLQCQWYYDYVKKGQTLSVDYRGDYRIEPFDYFYIQSQYQNRVPIVVTSGELTYNGGLKGKLEVLNV